MAHAFERNRIRMSRIKGKEFNEIKPVSFFPYIRYCKKTDEFVLLIPDMYEIKKEKVFKRQNAFETRISEADLYRLIRADEKEGFTFEEEQGDLDDDTYLGICFLQFYFYLSKDSLVKAKRINNVSSFSHKYFLKKRIPRGGRPLGSLKIVSEEEQLRLEDVYNRRKEIMEKCYEHDWADEYVALQKDIADYLKQRFMGKKKALKNFAIERREWLNN